MIQTRKQLGAGAEQLALAYFLARPGYRTLKSNFYCKGGEIDLILEWIDPSGDARSRGVLVFVEVRSRVSSRAWLDPLESLSPAKIQSLLRSIRYYLWKHPEQAMGREVRIDFVAVDRGEIRHYPSAIEGV